MNALTIFILVLGFFAVVGLVWRYASLPCPSWLVPLLENPYFEAVAGAGILIERAGIRPGMRVLDAGCGPGRVTLPLAERVGESGHVVALDIQPQMLAKLTRRLAAHGIGNVETVQAGLGEGRLPADAFDAAVLVAVLGEVPDKSTALREMHRSLRKGGVLSVTEVLPDPHYQPVSRVRELGRAAGFREVRLFSGWFSYTLNLVKEPEKNL